MTPAGWIFMITSWTAILSLFSFCLYRTLSADQKSVDEEQDDTASSQ